MELKCWIEARDYNDMDLFARCVCLDTSSNILYAPGERGFGYTGPDSHGEYVIHTGGKHDSFLSIPTI